MKRNDSDVVFRYYLDMIINAPYWQGVVYLARSAKRNPRLFSNQCEYLLHVADMRCFQLSGNPLCFYL